MDLSLISNREYVTLVGHYNNIGDKSLESQLRQKNYSQEKIAQIKAKFQKMPNQVIKSLNVEFNGASDLRFPQFNYYYTLYRQYSENGVMPFEGALTEQPAKIIDIFDVFDALHAETQEKQIAELKKQDPKVNRG